MIIIKPSYQILTEINGQEWLKQLELIGRVCYKSEGKITNDSAPKFIKSLIDRKHYSIIEHLSFSVKFICDVGVSHEIVRHRIASYAQESSRYCDYNKKHCTFILPCWIKDFDILNEPIDLYGNILRENSVVYNANKYSSTTLSWLDAMNSSELNYKFLRENGWKPEQSRDVLPKSLKTELVATYNLRQWKWFFEQRTAFAAHPQMRELTIPLLNDIKCKIPIIFDDIIVEERSIIK